MKTMEDLPQECCVKCSFYTPPQVKNQAGMCRRNPPKVFMIPTKEILGAIKPLFMSRQPAVDTWEWCGDYIGRLKS
jgi:hypothetical protein